jgi:GT2 family glycosyltransferase
LQRSVIEGRVTGLADGALVGWIAAGDGEDATYLEAAADGEAPFARARAEPGEDGRLHFAIPIPQSLRDGRMRFLDVRPLGSRRPLAGGPVIYDGGLFAPPQAEGTATVSETVADPPSAIDGRAQFVAPNLVEGWAFAPEEPQRRIELEILAGNRLVTRIIADQPRPELGEAGARRGFRVDLSRLLRRGPHDVTIRVVGYGEPLPGGRFRAGPFAPDGELDCPGYLDDDESRSLVAALPFEHLAFDAAGMHAERIAPRQINRLRRERSGFSFGGASAPTVLLILPGEPEAAAERIWRLQSHPSTALALAAEGPTAIRQAAVNAGYVLFARGGDILHPSTAAILARLDGTPDIVAWSRFCADEARAGSPGVALRRPRFDPATARHGAVSDTTLAVKGSLLAQAPNEALEALAKGRMHPLWFWLAGQDLAWALHPEALTSHTGGGFELPTRAEITADEPFYRRLLDIEGGDFTLERTAEALPFPYVLVPKRRAGVISVLIPYRDRSALTLRCVHALSRQALSGELELVLVNNQSDPEEAQAVLDGARELVGPGRVTALDYDLPFNHSAQNNLAARTAQGEVVVLCNNDMVLTDPNALEQLAAWALQPGIGAVGCRLHDPVRGLGSYGHRLAAPSDNPFQPVLRENSDPAYAGHVHACPGVTMALAAISRERFFEIGGLDETRFPIGYNDLDFMLRASAQGLTHLYLGHLAAEHARASSRTGDNEDLQALWVNQLYPAAAAGHVAQLVQVRIAPEPFSPPAPSEPAAPVAAATETAELKALQAQIDGRRSSELSRAEKAIAMSRAGAIARRLGRELGGFEVDE